MAMAHPGTSHSASVCLMWSFSLSEIIISARLCSVSVSCGG
jgi:hypothetical protein